jgi:hypothetical protein
MKKNIQTREYNNLQVILRRIDDWGQKQEDFERLEEYLKKHDELMKKLDDANRAMTSFTWNEINTPYNI